MNVKEQEEVEFTWKLLFFNKDMNLGPTGLEAYVHKHAINWKKRSLYGISHNGDK